MFIFAGKHTNYAFVWQISRTQGRLSASLNSLQAKFEIARKQQKEMIDILITNPQEEEDMIVIKIFIKNFLDTHGRPPSLNNPGDWSELVAIRDAIGIDLIPNDVFNRAFGLLSPAAFVDDEVSRTVIKVGSQKEVLHLNIEED